ncbi:hypothetical protein CRE_14771 [Caenorhabditis remanei]|uniref:Uncharacterized protein n=1 Tax=Caenorhabditis remanei TaxID=31234 RepID=E3MRV8_CAERE|nr:hypothetical protein CRE_14771 [Caenorhabditis remanei]
MKLLCLVLFVIVLAALKSVSGAQKCEEGEWCFHPYIIDRNEELRKVKYGFKVEKGKINRRRVDFDLGSNQAIERFRDVEPEI